jgi:hypothetical protein
VRDPLSDYRRGVRRDPYAFTALKEDKQWDSWQHGTIAQARAQDLSEILDSNFVPATPEATELFVEKQKFFYTLFDKVLLTDKGKLLVRQYRHPDGTLLKLKTRICANGSMQEQGRDFTGSYAPVVQWSSVHLCLILATMLGIPTQQIDFTQAFCNADIDEDVYISIPQGWCWTDKMTDVRRGNVTSYFDDVERGSVEDRSGKQPDLTF